MTTRLLLLLFCSLSFATANAQSAEKDIASSVDALTKAMITPDKSMLDKLTAEKLSFGHSTGLVENKSAFEQNILSGNVKFTSIDNTNQSIEITDDVAVVRYIAAIKGMNKGAPLDLKIGILMIWQKQGNDWKLLARQGYKLP
jgi:Calcium/calmodulin dependent protein kinase II Association.